MIPPPENCSVYEIMWKNIVELEHAAYVSNTYCFSTATVVA
jgi:hypothetical protein